MDMADILVQASVDLVPMLDMGLDLDMDMDMGEDSADHTDSVLPDILVMDTGTDMVVVVVGSLETSCMDW